VQNCPELLPNHLMRSTAGAARLFPISSNITTADSHAGTFSAACAVTIWKGGALPAGYDGSALSCDPTGNLVHADRLIPSGATFSAEPLLEKRELLASRDDWFRPVYLASGPDGALYVCDMYRKVIEHPDYLPEEVRKRTDFDSGREMGRIWRISDRPFIPGLRSPVSEAPDLAGAALGVASGPGFGAAHSFRLLVEAGEKAVPHIRAALARKPTPAGRAALLRLLEIGGALADEDLENALRDADSGVRETALFLAESRPAVLARLLATIEGRRPHLAKRERFQLALTLGAIPGDAATRELGELMLGVGTKDRWLCAAVLSGVNGRAAKLLPALFYDMRRNGGNFDFFLQLGRTIGLGKERGSLDELLAERLHGEDGYAVVAGFCEATGERVAPGESRSGSLLEAAVEDLLEGRGLPPKLWRADAAREGRRPCA
jgi:hypothetical protein